MGRTMSVIIAQKFCFVKGEVALFVQQKCRLYHCDKIGIPPLAEFTVQPLAHRCTIYMRWNTSGLINFSETLFG